MSDLGEGLTQLCPLASGIFACCTLPCQQGTSPILQLLERCLDVPHHLVTVDGFYLAQGFLREEYVSPVHTLYYPGSLLWLYIAQHYLYGVSYNAGDKFMLLLRCLLGSLGPVDQPQFLDLGFHYGLDCLQISDREPHPVLHMLFFSLFLLIYPWLKPAGMGFWGFGGIQYIQYLLFSIVPFQKQLKKKQVQHHQNLINWCFRKMSKNHFHFLLHN